MSKKLARTTESDTAEVVASFDDLHPGSAHPTALSVTPTAHAPPSAESLAKNHSRRTAEFYEK